jgi:Flp pilus assembly protein TadG
MRDLPKKPRGAAAVEFALVLPFLLTMVLGAIDWGWYFCVREVAINAAREGARTASLLGNTTANGVARANAYLASAGLCADGASAGAGAGGNVRVDVTCTDVVLTRFFPPALVPRTVSVSAEMRHE